MKKQALLSTAVALGLLTASGVAHADNHGSKDVVAEKSGKHMRKGPGKDLDTNEDGVVSKAEFLSHAEKRFEKIDADGNGEISKEEGKAAHDKMRKKKKDYMQKRKSEKPAE